MSWQDRDKLDLKIFTGDGKEYTVSWLTASQKTKWHGGDFSFINLNDTLVRKRKRQGRIFPLEFFFQGDDHLEEAAAFRASLDDPNPCRIEHPYYNTIVAQIMELDIDNSALNVSRCSCTAIETMVGESATITDKIDMVLMRKVELDDLLEDQPEITGLSVTEINSVIETTSKNKTLADTIISIQEEAQDYENLFHTASTKLNAFTAGPLEAMIALNNLLLFPAQFTATVQNRVRILKEQFDVLRGTISGLLNPSAKKVWFNQQTNLLSTMCKAAVTPLERDYKNAIAALRVASIIHNAYKTFQEDLDELQTSNNGSPLSFVPDFDLSIKLEETILATVSGLYQIALNGRRSRTYTLTEDSNIILLTHMLLRLDDKDENIDELIEINNLTYKEIMLGIGKGRTITYYV